MVLIIFKINYIFIKKISIGGDSNKIFLSTAKNELGVLFAKNYLSCLFVLLSLEQSEMYVCMFVCFYKIFKIL